MRILSLFHFFGLFFLFSCGPEESILPVDKDIRPDVPTNELAEIIDEVEYTFYLDGEPVIGKSLDLEQEGIHVVVIGKPSKKYASTVEMQVFTTDESYYRFGHENYLPLEMSHQLDLAIAADVEKHRVEEYFLETGEVQPGFYERVGCIRRELQEYDGLDSPSQEKAFLASLYTSCTSNSPHFFGYTYMGIMARNNEVSRIRRNNLFGTTHLYDKRFFRKRMFSVYNWGFLPSNEINMCNHPVYQHFNNKLSSALFL